MQNQTHILRNYGSFYIRVICQQAQNLDKLLNEMVAIPIFHQPTPRFLKRVEKNIGKMDYYHWLDYPKLFDQFVQLRC
jgi:hypothetical protein